MDSNKYFRNDIITHKRKIFKNMQIMSNELMDRAFEHDNDKIENDVVYNIYNIHCQTQRSIPFGSKERIEFEGTTMKEGIDLHIMLNRHHLYNTRNELTFEDANLLDYLEILCDWVAAMGRHEMTQEEEVNRINGLMDKYNFPADIRKPFINTYYKLKK